MNPRSDWLDTAQRAADRAEKIIRHYYRSDVEVTLKADRSPVTQADVESEQAIRETIRRDYPEHDFLGEETGFDKGTGEGVQWLIDPIDGTKSFVRGYPFVSTQIAVMERDELTVGLSNAPLFQERAWAILGQGAWLNGDPITVSDIDAWNRATLSTGNIGSLARSSGWNGLGQLVSTCDRIRGYGDFYHYHLLAAGRIDAVVESDVNILDIAALAVVVEAAGGRITDLNGGPINLQTTTVVATNGLLHDIVLEHLHGA
ncbi:MAG: inositol monophosphatase family protein [Xanthomonadales bacterium]|nr:inositol monophosphatase family protein [Xanthomonadales bacterium]